MSDETPKVQPWPRCICPEGVPKETDEPCPTHDNKGRRLLAQEYVLRIHLTDNAHWQWTLLEDAQFIAGGAGQQSKGAAIQTAFRWAAEHLPHPPSSEQAKR